MTAGIPLDAVDFYAELEHHNTKEWWAANRSRWENSVRAPIEALIAELEPEFGPAKVFRPHRDVRFSNDKTPYKTHQGAVVLTSESVGFYVQISATGLLTAGGWYSPETAKIAAFRGAVLSQPAGTKPADELTAIVTELEADGFEVTGDRLKTAPRGVDPTHKHIALLRHKTLLTQKEHGTPDWLATPEVIDQVREDWLTYRPLLSWLDQHLAS